MIKAIFVDYTGTIITQGGKELIGSTGNAQIISLTGQIPIEI